MTLRTFEALRSFIPLLFSFVICVCLPVFKAKSDSRRWEKYMLLIQVSLCYIPKHLEDRKAWYVHIYYTWCDIILIFKLHRRTRLTPRSSIHSLKIRMMSHPCNKYEHTTLSYLLSVNYIHRKEAQLPRIKQMSVCMIKSNKFEHLEIKLPRFSYLIKSWKFEIPIKSSKNENHDRFQT